MWMFFEVFEDGSEKCFNRLVDVTVEVLTVSLVENMTL